MTLREYRLRLGKTQADFAEVCGITTAAYQQWESGARTPGANALIKLATSLNLVISFRPGENTYDVTPAAEFKHHLDDLSQEELKSRLSEDWEDV